MDSASGMVQPSNMAVNLLLVGRNSNGKSSTGNTILGGKYFKTSSISQSSIENICHAEKEIAQNKIITVVDGPYIKDTDLNDPGDIDLALKCGNKAMELCPDGFDAVIIVLKYGVRFTNQEKDAINLTRAMFGDNVIKDHGIVVFTYGDSFALDVEEDKASFESWCKNQTGYFAELLTECSNRIILFNNRNEDSKWLQRDDLLACVDKLQGKRYTYNDYKQAESGRTGLVVTAKRPRLEDETRKVLNEIGVSLEKIDVRGNPDFSKIEIIALKKKLQNHKAEIVKEAAGTQLLTNIFNTIKVTEMNLDTKLRLADVALQTIQHEQQQRHYQDEESTYCLRESRQSGRDCCTWAFWRDLLISIYRWLCCCEC